MVGQRGPCWARCFSQQFQSCPQAYSQHQRARSTAISSAPRDTLCMPTTLPLMIGSPEVMMGRIVQPLVFWGWVVTEEACVDALVFFLRLPLGSFSNKSCTNHPWLTFGLALLFISPVSKAAQYRIRNQGTLGCSENHGSVSVHARNTRRSSVCRQRLGSATSQHSPQSVRLLCPSREMQLDMPAADLDWAT